VGGLTRTTNSTAPIRHRLPDFSKELSGTPVVSAPTVRQFAATTAEQLRRRGAGEVHAITGVAAAAGIDSFGSLSELADAVSAAAA
jgi:hypothetical protein